MSPRNTKKPDESRKRIDEYFRICDSRNEPTSLPGLALHLGYCDVHSMRSVVQRSEKGQNLILATEIKKGILEVERRLAAQAQRNTGQVAGAIFLLKASHGYREDDKGDLSRTIPEMVQQMGAIVMQYVDKAKHPEVVAKLQEIASAAMVNTR